MLTVTSLGGDDVEPAAALRRLAFGGSPAAPPDPFGAEDQVGVLDDRGRLVAAAAVRPYEQWWGGRRVPMGGVASLAVHPDVRGRGTASRLVRALLPRMQERGQALSVLFPTVVGLYRPLGWEIVGSLDETRIPVAALRGAGRPEQVVVRAAEHADRRAVGALYDDYGATSAGLLARSGAMFPRGSPALEHDLVGLARATGDGAPVGYVAYDRGRGYGPDASLRVLELVARTGAAAAALLASLGSWEGVVGSVLWRGPTDDLDLLLRSPVPAPERRSPWMLRIVDAEAAVAARGFPSGVRADAAFVLVDPDVARHDGAWRLLVADGSGRLERLDGQPDVPLLHVRGLALLYAGAGDTGLLLRAGLLDRPAPALDAAFAGPRPRILDSF